VGTTGLVVFGCIVAVIFFAWGWFRAARFRTMHARSPWGIHPIGWGLIHVFLFPIAWIMYFGAQRFTRIPDASLASSADAVIADTAEDREQLLAIVARLPTLAPPSPATRGWHPDPLAQRKLRYFDSQKWTRDVTDEPVLAQLDAVGDPHEDLRRRLRALAPPSEGGASWHIDPLAEAGFRYFDGEHWTEDIR